VTGSRFLRRKAATLISAIALVVVTALGAAPGAGACGRDTDCVIGERSYRIALPEGRDGTTPIGAIVFVHGYRGTANGVMRNKALTALAADLGVAFIAAQAGGPDWNIPGAPSHHALEGIDELAYFDALIEDVTARFAIDRTRLVASGFSAGAMMVWHLACYRGASFAGFVPMSGTFWAPVPETCPSGPVNLIHYHGDADPMVPLTGRPIENARQGNVFEAIELIARSGSYRPIETGQTPELQCARQVADDGKLLELCLFPGKHQLKASHLARAWRIFEASAGR
jgi:polyhydroxybutyrate depolymerase